MLDSCNFIKYNVGKLDTKRLMDLGIVYHKLQYRNGKYGKAYVYYGNMQDEIDDYLISKGIGFEYKNVHFLYLEKFKCIILIANTHKVLQKFDICLSDRDLYIDEINEIVKQVLNIDYSQLYLYRIDYCVDLVLDYEIMYEYLHLLNKHKSTYCNIKRINEYETSIYLTSKGGQKRINIYDKYKCEKDKYYAKFEKSHMSLAEYEKNNPKYYEYYKNIFRIEVQNTKNLINNKSKKLKPIESIAKDLFTDDINAMIHHKQEKSLYGYWNKESMKTYFFDFLKDFLYTGTYYKTKDANKKIKKSKYSDCEKKHLKEFVTLVNQYGISNITKSNIEKPVKHKTWNKETICEYIIKLLSIGIAFTTIEKDYIKSVDKATRMKLQKQLNTYKQVIDNSNCGESEKKDLKDFLIAINKYGFKNVIEKDNKTQSIHSKWCGATVNTYIKNLEALGIDLIHLDKAQNKQQLKMAKDKVDKSKHSKSWKTKLKDFATVVNDYGIADTITKDNKEIAEKSKNSKHHKYSYKTVEDYIEMLEDLGINPVTLDNNSEFDKLESLYTLIEKVAQKKYFDIDNLEIPAPAPKNENEIYRKRKMIGGF